MSKEQASGNDTGYVSNPVELFKLSIKALALNVGPLIAVVLLPIAVILPGIGAGFAIAYFVSKLPQTTAYAGIAVALALILYLIYLLMVISIASYPVFLATAKGEAIKFKQAYETAKALLWPIAWTSLLGGLIVFAGSLLLIVPGILFAIWFSLAPYVVIEEKLMGKAALKRSKQLVEGNAIEVVGVLALSFAAYIVASFVPLAGDIFSMVVSLAVGVALAYRYFGIKKLKDAGKSVPKAHRTNWIFISLIPVLLALGIFLVGVGILKDPDASIEQKESIEKIDWNIFR